MLIVKAHLTELKAYEPMFLEGEGAELSLPENILIAPRETAHVTRLNSMLSTN